ncbi:MAG: OmpA family protein [Bacteroidales bacterium]|nr:OmpA family protein [Bacteroidales bacterium]
MSEIQTSNESVSQNTKEKSGSKFWAWLLAALLLVLAAFFVWDKIKSNKKYANLETEHQQTAGEFLKYKSEHESMEANYSDLQRRYDALNSQIGGSQSEISTLKKRLADQDSVVKALRALKNDVAKALDKFSSDELKIQEKDGKLYLLLMDKLLFKSASADIEARGQSAIKKIAKELAKNPDFGILVEGHTDNQPIKNSQYKDNWDLSTARATTVVRFLSENGLPQKRLTAAGRGEFSPISTNATEAGRAQNRRTEIILTPNFVNDSKALAK